MSNINRSELIEKLERYIEPVKGQLNSHIAIGRDLLLQTFEFMSSDPPPSHDAINLPLVDGRFAIGNSEIFIDMRIDSAGSSVISADIFRLGDTGKTYDCSIRTNPGRKILASESNWSILGTDESGNIAVGELSLQNQDVEGRAIIGNLRVETALGTLPVQSDIHFAGNHVSTAMRVIGLELETEVGVGPLPSFQIGTKEVTLQNAFRNAGIEIVSSGIASKIPNPSGNKWGTAQLHALMTDFAQAPLNLRAWQFQLLLLGQSSRNGLLGVMFDSTSILPRQGCAVFKGEVDEVTSGTHADRKLIQTTLHELGHALNLAHRFERKVGHPDSFSIMNYDWRFRGGNQAQEFWSGFDFTFDPDELEFLRHAPLPLVIPGGAAFHSVDYWSNGNGQYSPYVPEIATTLLSISLSPPSSGPVFAFGQQVFLQVRLTNLNSQPLNLQQTWLDVKSGFIEFQIVRQGQDTVIDFHPILERCFDLSGQTADIVNPGDSLTNNVNLTFGSAGFPFIEPGTYDIIAILALPIKQNGQDVEIVVRSIPLRIRVALPMSLEEEGDALILFREDVGTFLSLGGSVMLSEANSSLQELLERRQGKKKPISDPIVASIIRCQGIDAGRSYTRYKNGKYIQIDGRREEAAELLGRLTPSALNYFDDHTATATRRLCEKHKRSVNKKQI